MNPIRRSIARFQADPASIRRATIAISSLTVVVVVLGAIVIRIFDPEEYPTFAKAMWFTLQTITTVGYGDATPERPIGRIVASIVMVTAIALITVISAAVTSVFIEALQRDRSGRTEQTEAFLRIEGSLSAIDDRLDQLESALAAERTDSIRRGQEASDP